jgi:hypothetical protein
MRTRGGGSAESSPGVRQHIPCQRPRGRHAGFHGIRATAGSLGEDSRDAHPRTFPHGRRTTVCAMIGDDGTLVNMKYRKSLKKIECRANRRETGHWRGVAEGRAAGPVDSGTRCRNLRDGMEDRFPKSRRGTSAGDTSPHVRPRGGRERHRPSCPQKSRGPGATGRHAPRHPHGPARRRVHSCVLSRHMACAFVCPRSSP